MIDGINNSVIETDVVMMDEPTKSEENWAGNGFVTVKKELKIADEEGRKFDAEKGRTWR
jgi:primary-amine oxidase